MELAQGGNLYQLLKDTEPTNYPWSRRLRLLRDIAFGLSVLHAHEFSPSRFKEPEYFAGRGRPCQTM